LLASPPLKADFFGGQRSSDYSNPHHQQKSGVGGLSKFAEESAMSRQIFKASCVNEFSGHFAFEL
jgi:hypothetical protein